jgi:predicted RNA-binding Zn ribbon-like protein
MTTSSARQFFWVGNHPGIDLVNTEAVDAHGERLELVPDLSALVDWAWTAGLIDSDLARQCRAVADGRERNLVAWFRRLRSAVRDLLECGDEEAAAALDDAVSAVAVRLSYRLTRPSHQLPLDAPGPLERLRLALATSALGAAGLDRSRVRRCGSPRCVLLYYDTTKNRSRRWCDMAVCGNRAKATAHYKRTKQP